MPKMNMIEFLDKNVKPATGCTEPIAVAYATAVAYRELVRQCPGNGTGRYCANMADNLTISIRTDRDVFKNAHNVMIPNTIGEDGKPLTGMAIAAAMALYASPEDNLNLLANVGKEAAYEAKKLIESGKIIIEEVEDDGAKADLNIEVTVKCGEKIAYAHLQHNHDNITELKLNGQHVRTYDEVRHMENAAEQEYFPQSIEEIVASVDEIDLNTDRELFERLYEGVEMDIKLAEEGLRHDMNYGLKLGKELQEQYHLHGETFEELLQNYNDEKYIHSIVEILTSAAGDARMGGANLPAMSSAGSGNQGLVAVLPLVVAGKVYKKTDEELCKAVLLSHLTTKYVGNYSGHLSAMCGCNIKAGIGAAAGLTYLLSDDAPDKTRVIHNAINYQATNTLGTICDGAKTGCAQKLSTGARESVKSALLARRGKGPGPNGVVRENANDTIKNIGELCESMVSVDLKVVQLLQKNKLRR